MSSLTSPDYGDPATRARTCQNCSTVLSGPYCAACGQHDVDYHRSFHHLFHDLLENLFHFEGKFFATVAWLLAKPGRITLEFLAGRRASQLNPLRFYIFVSVLFFLGVSLLNHGHLIDIPRQQVDRLQLDLGKQVNEAKDLTIGMTKAERKALIRRIAESAEKNEGKVDRAAIMESIIAERAATTASSATAAAPAAKAQDAPTKVRINQSTGIGQNLVRKISSGELTFSAIWDALEHRIPTLLFLGVPLFALLLKLFYLGSGRFYIEHLIFSLHLHTWLFLVIMVGNGYLKLAALGSGWLDNVCGWALTFWALWYFFWSFRVVYAQGRFKTAVKIAFLGMTHAFALLMLAVALAWATVVWLAYE